MRKGLVGIVLLAGVVLTTILVFSDSNASSILSKPSSGTPSGTVTQLPKGTTLAKRNSTVVVPPGTVSPSPSNHLEGIVTPLAKLPIQENGDTSSKIASQCTTAPSLGWNIYNRGFYLASFKGATNTTGSNTNYLFSISSSYDLKVDMNVTGENSSTTQYKVYLLDHMVNDGVVYSNVLPVGQSFTVTYPNLNPTHLYYVRWSAVDNNQFIDGKFSVHY